MSQAELAERLAALSSIDASAASQVSQVARNVAEALLLLGREPDGEPSPGRVKEYYSEESGRLYYCIDDATPAYNSWHAPPRFAYAEWSLDADLYRIPLPLARDLYRALEDLLAGEGAAPPPAVAQRALEVLASLVGNVADCSNADPKYRMVKASNQKFATAVWEVPTAAAFLRLVGFRAQGDLVRLSEDANLPLIQAAASRLRRLAARKGHSGSAVSVAPDGDAAGGSGRPPSPFYNTPGFRWQQRIYHCSACNYPINDGSERLWGGKHDAPQGEYRFMCTTCEGSGAATNLCQRCWDAFQGGDAALHAPSHAFQHIGPRLSRHNDYYGDNHGAGESGSDAASPWGRGPGGAGLGRALSRLQERYGIQEWL